MLELQNVRAGYGKVEVLHGVSMAIGEREIVGLVGHNGAGKTTLVKTISGQLKAFAGLVNWTHGRVPSIGVVPQGRSLFADLTVAENLRLASYVCDLAVRGERTDAVLETFPILAQRRGQIAGSLSGGQQQMLSIGIALMGRPDLLLLDEPSLGLAPSIAEQVLAIVAELRDGGMSILMVEQSVTAAARVADRLAVLRSGDLVAELDTASILEDPQVLWDFF